MIEIPLTELTEKYVYVDPASGKKEQELKRVRARSAVVVIAPDQWGRIFVLEAWAKRCSTSALIDKIYAVNDAFKPRRIGGEANGMQSLFQDAVLRDAKLQGKYLPLDLIYQPTRVEKDYRIRTRLGPFIAQGKLFIRDDMTELKTEIAGFPLTPFKDLVDALASAIAMVPPKQSQPRRDAETEKLLKYLRSTGAPASYISEVARRRGLGRDAA